MLVRGARIAGAGAEAGAEATLARLLWRHTQVGGGIFGNKRAQITVESASTVSRNIGHEVSDTDLLQYPVLAFVHCVTRACL